MVILYHHRTMGRGAEGLHIASIAKAFQSLGHRVIMLSPPGIDPLKVIGENPLDKTCEKTKGVNTLWKNVSKYAPQIIFEVLEILYNVSAVFRMKRIIENNNIDFIYERNAFFLFAGAFLSNRFNIPFIIETNEVVGVKRARKLTMKRLAKWIEKKTFERASAIFTVSSYLEGMIRDVVSRNAKVYLTPNAVDPSLFSIKTKRDEIRERYNLSGKIVLGFAGWFDWWDRLDLLVEVQKDIEDIGYHNVKTMLIGDGPIVNDLKKQIQMLNIQDNIILTGAVERKKIIDYLDALDIGIIAHSNEFGSPVVLFEMMALGKLIIAPSVKPINDVIIHGENGLIFPALDKKALIDKVLLVLENPKLGRTIGENARKSVFEKYTWINNAKTILRSSNEN
jgi:glycosyltransferase involved in cell wall biosynthesis